jgi:hypothetical protein
LLCKHQVIGSIPIGSTISRLRREMGDGSNQDDPGMKIMRSGRETGYEVLSLGYLTL